MTPEEEVKMMNEDHEIWKQSQEQAKRVANLYDPNICDIPGIDIDLQLEQIIMNYRALSNLNQYKYTPFSATAPLYLNPERKTLLCTTDDRLAQLWVFQINEKLQKSREAVIEELVKQSSSKEDLERRLEGVFSARCIDMSIDPCIGDRDHEIAGLHYIGIIVSHYYSERNGIYDAVKECEEVFLSGKSYIGTIRQAQEKGIVK